jgi:fatty acid desaturase
LRQGSLFCILGANGATHLSHPASETTVTVLRNRADLRTLAFIATYFVALAAAWSLPLARPLTVLVAVAFLCWISWINAVITHNVVHVPMWRSTALNRATRVVLSLTYGFPVSEYIPGHNLSHHRYVQARRDVMRTSKVAHKWNLLNVLTFFFAVAFDVGRANGRYVEFAKGRRADWYRERQVQMLVTWGVKVVLLLVDWKKALLFVGVPHLAAVWGITTVNFLQHDGCDPDHSYNHSRNFVGTIFNWFHFNNGFHGMHHMEPGLHWSLLPAKHAEIIAPHIHPELDRKSLAVYLVKTFVLETRRLRYDGELVVLLNEGADEDWIGPPAEADAALPSPG